MRWIETITDEEATKVHFGMWDTVWRKQDGGALVGGSSGPMEGDEFWYHALEKAKHDPDRRIEIARGSLPINAAWREIATGLRAKIKLARKAKADYEADLLALHHLAALHSFAFTTIRGGDCDFMALVPYARLAALDLSYELLGCNELALLGVTDRKWMIEKWGEASQHTTAMKVYRDLHKVERSRVDEVEARHREENTINWLFPSDRDKRLIAQYNKVPAERVGPFKSFFRSFFN